MALCWVLFSPYCISAKYEDEQPPSHADDSLLHRKVRTIEVTHILQEEMIKLEQWDNYCQMQFNQSKCETIHTTRKYMTSKRIYDFMVISSQTSQVGNI
ncbi:hypothetical protein DPMN_128792 [Dreissena polymorpha]|uniref:Uncharacterized protein n=1 Tax=Dreissena polymorpha TaxID=45954 RepID=A0A9D4JWS3_DREPO|nr:hypothetical protein DPMN_128792 [Dreissena polymorpha]